MSYRVSELEKLRLLLGKQHRSAKDVAIVFDFILKRCAEEGMDCQNCPLCFCDDDICLCTLMKRYVADCKEQRE